MYMTRDAVAYKKNCVVLDIENMDSLQFVPSQSTHCRVFGKQSCEPPKNVLHGGSWFFDLWAKSSDPRPYSHVSKHVESIFGGVTLVAPRLAMVCILQPTSAPL